MSNTYQIYLISDSTGETLDRIFLALKAQFENIEYKVHSYSFTRTENQILKILEDAKKNDNSVILYTIVDNNLDMPWFKCKTLWRTIGCYLIAKVEIVTNVMIIIIYQK